MTATSRGSNMRDQEWWVNQGYARNHPLYSDPAFEWHEAGGDPAGDALETRNQATGRVPKLTVAPTRTSNKKRPRTLAAGYDHESDTLRVVFRDGATYDYFAVTTDQWNRFRKSASPGRFINRVLDDHDYTRVE